MSRRSIRKGDPVAGSIEQVGALSIQIRRGRQEALPEFVEDRAIRARSICALAAAAMEFRRIALFWKAVLGLGGDPDQLLIAPGIGPVLTAAWQSWFYAPLR